MMSVERNLKRYAEAPISRQMLSEPLAEYSRPNDKISELLRAGVLTAVKKGFYIPGPNSDIQTPEPFLIANHLWGPSYVSLESALSYWKLIPERVYEIASVCTKAAKIYRTDVGRFNYFHAAAPYYSFGIKSVSLTPKQYVLMASPEKAICDKIVMTSGVFLRSIRQTQEFLLEDLRIDEESLSQLAVNDIASWVADAPKSSSLAMLVKTLRTL